MTKDEALALDVKPEKPGLYFFAGEGKDDRGNRFTTSAFFYVTGKDFVPWEPRDRASRSGKFSRMKAAGAEEIFMAGTEPKQPCRFVHGSEAAENPVASVPAAGSDPDIPLKIVFPQLYRQGGDP